MADTPLNRTRGQWLRGWLTFSVWAAGGTGFVGVVVVWVIRRASEFIGRYVAGGIPHPSFGVGGLVGAGLGLAAGCVWAYVARPRRVRGGLVRTGGPAPVARYWTGLDGAPAGGAADPGPEVTR